MSSPYQRRVNRRPGVNEKRNEEGLRRSGDTLSIQPQLLTVVAGGIMAFSPLQGALTLAWLLVFWCFLRGIMQIIVSFQMTVGRGWRLAGGILSVLLAIMIWRGWPATALWALGLLVGLNMISAGVIIAFRPSRKAA